MAAARHNDWIGRGAIVALMLGAMAEGVVAQAADGAAGVQIRSFLPAKPVLRAARPVAVIAVVENRGDAAAEVSVRIVVPEGVRLVRTGAGVGVRIAPGEEKTLAWEVEAAKAMQCDLRLEITGAGAKVRTASLPMRFLEPVAVNRLPYIPEPVPAPTSLLIGAHHCPLWEADKPSMWANVLKHPERTPALGFYAQENPEVSDWETKWAVEHGVSFFIYCWYRTSQGGAVKTQFGSAIHDALFKSRFVDKMKFTIMWENQSRSTAGVADEKDLMTNLLPYWIDNYFKHPSYLKVDNKPVLFVYRPEFLVDDLGGVEKVAKALDRMRKACRDAGFAGLHILGEYRGLDPNHLRLMKRLGLDYTFAYCWYIENNPTPQQAIDRQMQYIKATQDLAILPQVATVSQAWSGWADEGSIWKIPPRDYESLLRQAKDFVATLPSNELGGKMLLLDNWNEWGEGHYIAPYREYGFGYLDAVRKVFSTAPDAHLDLLPEDIGLGPYDTAFRSHLQRQDEMRRLLGKHALKPGAPEQDLIAWWAFDEPADYPAALDYSGRRHGGRLRDAARAKGIDGAALVCNGGCAVVPNAPTLFPTSSLSIECWVKTDTPGQNNHWFVNSVFGGATSSGYRLGVLEGKPCFEIPLTDWSHHLRASEPLPTGRWVHVAGTYDGVAMRIYVDGRPCGVMPRSGPIRPGPFHLCLGTYEVAHASHFTGLLDEVKLYGRALSAQDIRSRYLKLAPHAGAAPVSR